MPFSGLFFSGMTQIFSEHFEDEFVDILMAGIKAKFAFFQMERLCHSIWLLHLNSAVKIQPFLSGFLLAEYRAKAFFRLSLWNFKEKSINHFL